MARGWLAVALAVAFSASASPITSPPSSNTTEPCAAVSQAVQTQTLPAIVPASLGQACLESIPVDIQGDQNLIEEIKFYLGWQSTLPLLKNPPAGSRQAPLDLLGELDDIKQGVANGHYASEYDVQNAIMSLFRSAHDGHLGWAADLATVVGFVRDPEAQLVSISEDGDCLPQIVTYSDVLRAANDTSFKPSAIVSINDQDAVQYLSKIADHTPWADDDARIASLLVNPAGLSISESSASGVFYAGAYDGPTTRFTFAYGTSRTFDNYAFIQQDFSGVDSGKAFFEKFCTGNLAGLANDSNTSSTTSSPSSATSTTSIEPTLTGYPYPVIKHSHNSVSGYFLNETGYEDVVIIAIPTFLIEPIVGIADAVMEAGRLLEFQLVVRRFIEACKKNNKKRLIIDLRNNGGGDPFPVMDTFKQLFPSMEPYYGVNMLHNQAYQTMGEIVTKYVEGNGLEERDHWAWYNARAQLYLGDEKLFLTEQGKNWTNFEEMYGPESDEFTRTFIENYNDEQTQGYGGGLSVSGYLNLTNVTKEQPFLAEDILVLEDYRCASACAAFHELLHHQAAIPVLKIGSLPHSNPITAPTGTKGALQLGLGQLSPWANLSGSLIPSAHTALQSAYNGSGLAELAHGMPNVRRRVAIDTALANSPAISVNARNQLRKGQNVPLQFVWEDAECKMWYTGEMYVDVTSVWRGAVDAWWGGRCVGQRQV